MCGKECKVFFVKTVSLDEYIKRNNIDKLNIIKIDVDGYDYKVLLGALETLKRFKPTLFVELSEVCLNQQGDSVSDIYNFLNHLNYTALCEERHVPIGLEEIYKKIEHISSINGIFIS